MYTYNPYMQQYSITHIKGEEGARALPMPPNSEALLLDDTAPMIWLVQVDGMGCKTVTPYEIRQYQPTPKPTIEELMSRIDSLEKKLMDKENTYDKSNTSKIESNKQSNRNSNEHH